MLMGLGLVLFVFVLFDLIIEYCYIFWMFVYGFLFFDSFDIVDFVFVFVIVV